MLVAILEQLTAAMKTANANRSVLLVPLLAIAGCGTTSIVTTDPRARIMVDGQQVGRGRGEITQTGLPVSSTVFVVTDDGRRQSLVVDRHFTGTTFVLGLFTYGICLVACWQYPDTVFVPLPAGVPMAYGQSPIPYDPWLQPPPRWQPSPPPPPPAPPMGPASPPTRDDDALAPQPTPPAPTAARKRAARVVAPSAEVHSAPFAVAPVVVSLEQGQSLFVDATPNAGWRVVLLDGRVGYIREAQIEVDSP
jgi:hypothetical protein